ncbi:hypothetical protein EV363DRAFT_1188041 [Boletus edulis]|nr:hypothetical protein EV363DRAFT_1188041 [Boletus edulis]
MGDKQERIESQRRSYSGLISGGASILEDIQSAIHTLERLHPHASTPKGQGWVQTLLTSHPDRIRRELSVRKQVFEQLVWELSRGHTHSEGITLEEQLAIFLYICTTGCRAGMSVN